MLAWNKTYSFCYIYVAYTIDCESYIIYFFIFILAAFSTRPKVFQMEYECNQTRWSTYLYLYTQKSVNIVLFSQKKKIKYDREWSLQQQTHWIFYMQQKNKSRNVKTWAQIHIRKLRSSGYEPKNWKTKSSDANDLSSYTFDKVESRFFILFRTIHTYTIWTSHRKKRTFQLAIYAIDWR